MLNIPEIFRAEGHFWNHRLGIKNWVPKWSKYTFNTLGDLGKSEAVFGVIREDIRKLSFGH